MEIIRGKEIFDSDDVSVDNSMTKIRNDFAVEIEQDQLQKGRTKLFPLSLTFYVFQ